MHHTSTSLKGLRLQFIVETWVALSHKELDLDFHWPLNFHAKVNTKSDTAEITDLLKTLYGAHHAPHHTYNSRLFPSIRCNSSVDDPVSIAGYWQSYAAEGYSRSSRAACSEKTGIE